MTIPAQSDGVRRRAWTFVRSLAMRIIPFAVVAWLAVSTGGGFPH